MYLTVKQAGALTTIQDQGRYGFQGQGIPVAGVMDALAMETVNILLGNALDHPVLECLGIGPVLEFSDSVFFAVGGGSFSVFLNDKEINIHTVYKAAAGDLLKITYSSSHRSCVVGFAADFAVKPVYGSTSTDIRSRIGGIDGRKLKTGDRIELTNIRRKLPYLDKRTLPPYPAKQSVTELRVLEGPDNDAFTEAGKQVFYSSEYTVSLQSDRMGFRLEGPDIETSHGNDILSAGIVRGSIQVTPQQAIMMMADHAATGGYTVIAVVIAADLSKASQLMPGDRIRFCKTTMEEAEKALHEQRTRLQILKNDLEPKGLMKLFYR